jgi:hypothetical protein
MSDQYGEMLVGTQKAGGLEQISKKNSMKAVTTL